MRNNRENWRYTLDRQRIHEISKVISNPALIEKIPFLMHWQYFERAGFNIFDILFS